MNSVPGQEIKLELSNRVGLSKEILSKEIPLPLEEQTNLPVVVCFYSDRWIPITFFSLAEAIALYQKALLLGKEILVYPPDFDLGQAQSL